MGARWGAVVPSWGMARRNRNRDLVADGVYHVWARGVRRLALFTTDDDRKQYLLGLSLVVEERGWHVYAYCLMDNHVHLLVQTPKPDLSQGVMTVHGDYARHINRITGHVGHAFDDRYGSTRARSSGDVMYIASYIALNPVRAGMCSRPEQYRWSSHAALAGKARAPGWLAATRLLGHFAADDVAPAKRYVQVVEAVRVLGVAGFDPGEVARGTPDLTSD